MPPKRRQESQPAITTKDERGSPSMEPEEDHEEDELDDDVEMRDGEDDDGEEEVGDPFVFQVRGAITPCGAQQMTLKELHEWIHDGRININPPYQRDAVWPDAKQITLIDSIFKNYYIPPLVFAVRWDPEEEEWVRTCIDGKQRLTSIMKFREGRIPHRDIVTHKSWFYTRPDNKKSKVQLELPESARKLFDEKELTVVDYYGISPKDERKVFERVQLGVPLTAGEKLRAVNAPKAIWISDLEQKHIAIENGISEYIKTQHNRGKDFQNLAQMVYFCEGIDGDVEGKPPGQVTLTAWLADTDSALSKRFMDDIEEMLLELRNIASDKKYNEGLIALQKSKKVFAPIEFVFMGILLYRIAQESKAVKAKALCAMISAVRESFVDVRANSGVVKTLWNYCNQLVKHPNRQVTVVHMAPAKKGKSSKSKP